MDVSGGSLRNLAALEHLDLSWNNLWGLPSDLLCPVRKIFYKDFYFIEYRGGGMTLPFKLKKSKQVSIAKIRVII